MLYIINYEVINFFFGQQLAAGKSRHENCVVCYLILENHVMHSTLDLVVINLVAYLDKVAIDMLINFECIYIVKDCQFIGFSQLSGQFFDNQDGY